jgi:hypothetical protein
VLNRLTLIITKKLKEEENFLLDTSSHIIIYLNNIFLIYIFFSILFFNMRFIEIEFIIFSNLIFMSLSQNHNPDHDFNTLTRVFFFFLINFILLNFILQHYVNWKLGFMIYFSLLSIRLFLSHDSGNKFDELNLVDSSCFLCSFLTDFFFNFIF